jgi:hypothetical protein
MFVWSTKWVFRSIQGRNLLVDIKSPCRLAEVSETLVELVKNAADTPFEDSFNEWVKKLSIKHMDKCEALSVLKSSNVICYME